MSLYQDETPVRIERLSKSYRSVVRRKKIHALRDVSLKVTAGEIFGLLGPNGAGKTTLVKILLSIAYPTAGEAYLFGLSARNPQSRMCIGYLPENHRPPEHLSPAKMLDLYGCLSRVPKAVRRKRIPELLERVGLSRWKDEKIGRFSKGMKQRVGMAQSLMNDPALIVLDEPTDGVDPVGRREIRDLLVWLRDQGKTIFLNSHLLSEVEQVCSRVAILNQGRLIREGTISSFLTTRGEFEIVSTIIPASTLAAFGGKMVPVPESTNGLPDPYMQTYRVTVEDRRHLNDILDRLRNDLVELETVRPVKPSFEDIFVDLVGKNPESSD